MKGFHTPIEKKTKENTKFQDVSYTGHYLQVVYMSLKPGEDIGEEVHASDQFFRFEAGEGQAMVDDTVYTVKDGDAVVVPSSAKHNVKNTGTEDLKFYTIYAVPNHPAGQQFQTKADAKKQPEKPFDGKVTEEKSN